MTCKDMNMKSLMKHLLNILENQEVSLFSISVDDVSPNVRAHLQSAKASNMYVGKGTKDEGDARGGGKQNEKEGGIKEREGRREKGKEEKNEEK